MSEKYAHKKLIKIHLQKLFLIRVGNVNNRELIESQDNLENQFINHVRELVKFFIKITEFVYNSKPFS